MVGPERRYFLAIGGVGGVMLVALVSYLVSTASGGDSSGAAVRLEAPASSSAIPGVVSATPSVTGTQSATATPAVSPAATEAGAPAPTPASTSAPSAIPAIAPASAPAPTAEAAATENTAPATIPEFAGRWRIRDTVTQGAGAGQSVTFDVVLVQTGPAFTGGNLEVSISGTADGNSISAQFALPSGVTGSYSWTLNGKGSTGGGTFQTSVASSGTSLLLRLP